MGVRERGDGLHEVAECALGPARGDEHRAEQQRRHRAVDGQPELAGLRAQALGVLEATLDQREQSAQQRQVPLPARLGEPRAQARERLDVGGCGAQVADWVGGDAPDPQLGRRLGGADVVGQASRCSSERGARATRARGRQVQLREDVERRRRVVDAGDDRAGLGDEPLAARRAVGPVQLHGQARQDAGAQQRRAVVEALERLLEGGDDLVVDVARRQADGAELDGRERHAPRGRQSPRERDRLHELAARGLEVARARARAPQREQQVAAALVVVAGELLHAQRDLEVPDRLLPRRQRHRLLGGRGGVVAGRLGAGDRLGAHVVMGDLGQRRRRRRLPAVLERLRDLRCSSARRTAGRSS